MFCESNVFKHQLMWDAVWCLHLPFAGKIKWMIEFPPAWKWFVTWSPGQIPQHFKESSPMPGPSSSTAALQHQHHPHARSLWPTADLPSTSTANGSQPQDAVVCTGSDASCGPVVTAQSTEMSLNRTWNVRADERTKRFLARRPKTCVENTYGERNVRRQHWKSFRKKRVRLPASQPASMWSRPAEPSPRSLPDGYQSSASTQRAGDATRDATHDDTDLLDGPDFEEYWRLHTEDLHWWFSCSQPVEHSQGQLVF